MDRFQMPGQMIVYVFDKSQIPQGIANVSELVGAVVKIDGMHCEVLNVDAQPGSDSEHGPAPQDFGPQDFGLMVKVVNR